MQSVSVPVIRDEELQHYLGTAWGTARLLGATFSPECWGYVTTTIKSSVASAPPAGDEVAFAASPDRRAAIVHGRVVRLVELMFEEAIRQVPPEPAPPPGLGPRVVVLHEWTLTHALQFKLCVWPFWLSGC